MLFKNTRRSKQSSETQLLASIKNIANSDAIDRQEKLHIQPNSLTKIKSQLHADELSEKAEKSEIKINDIKRIVLENSYKSYIKTEASLKEKSGTKWSSFEKKEQFEVEGQDDMDFEKSRGKLLKDFGLKLTKGDVKEKNMILT